MRELGSQEALIGVNVYLPGTALGTTTNTYGFYSLTLPAQDSLQLAYSYVGYQTHRQTIPFRQNTTLTILLTPGRLLAAVDVKAGRSEEKVSEQLQMSQIDLPVAQIKQIPAIMGEKDVLKVLQLLPGVQKGSEGQTGLYVRGGGPDQNLIILDEATVYNANHLFGFFSVFNGDALKSVELIKGGFPARYGGRLSSVIELNMKDGNKERLHGEGGIGLIASRLTLEGPFTKNKKGSFLVSARRTYLDVLMAPILAGQSDNKGKGGYYFYDVNAKANYDFGPKNKLYLSGYLGRDRFYANDLASNNSLSWGNVTGTLRWNHLFNQKLFSNLSLIYSDYQFQIASDERLSETLNSSLRYSSGVRDVSAKFDVDYYPSAQHSIRLGAQMVFHQFTPSALIVNNPAANAFNSSVNTIKALETGVYVEDTWRPSQRWRINGGVRLSSFTQQTAHYWRPEPRLSASYQIRPALAAKFSYGAMNQYIHLLSNTGIGLPTDLWVPTTDRVKPQQSQQLAIGLATDFADDFALGKGFALTVEGYYKSMRNLVNYKEGASFLLIDDPKSTENVDWQDNVTTGKGWSYGAEVLFQRKIGRLSGWVGYTLSWTKWQFADLNAGNPFYPRYDRRHDISLVGIYKLSPRITLSATWVYGTGNALTLPLASYSAYGNDPGLQTVFDVKGSPYFISPFFDGGTKVNEYSPQKNNFRAEAYHRLDLSLQFHKQKKHHERTWEFSVYNAYNRWNPFFYRIEPVYSGGSSPVGLFRYSVFPILPSISYNFKF
ncbi:TonB-dependent receptor [Spirosoma harenae]